MHGNDSTPSLSLKMKLTVGYRDINTVPKTAGTSRHRKVGSRAYNNLSQPIYKKAPQREHAIIFCNPEKLEM